MAKVMPAIPVTGLPRSLIAEPEKFTSWGTTAVADEGTVFCAFIATESRRLRVQQRSRRLTKCIGHPSFGGVAVARSPVFPRGRCLESARVPSPTHEIGNGCRKTTGSGRFFCESGMKEIRSGWGVSLFTLVPGRNRRARGPSNLSQRLAEQELSIGKLVIPLVPKFFSLCFDLHGLVFLPTTAKKIGKHRPGTGYAGRISKVILWIGLPRHQLLQQLLVRFDRFGRLTGLGIVVGSCS